MSQVAKMNIILIALLLSVGLNIYSLIILNGKISPNNNDKTINLEWSHCINIGRYDNENKEDKRGGQEIDDADAKKKVEYYREKHNSFDSSIYRTTGFLFSKRALDHIFNSRDTKINTVRFDLMVNNDSLRLIAKGISFDFTGIKYNEAGTTRVFINESMCPSDCQDKLWW